MRSQRRKQIVTLSVLLTAVLTHSIGFAIFSSNLNIQSGLSVKPDSSSFGVKFYSSETTLDVTTIIEVETTDSPVSMEAIYIQ